MELISLSKYNRARKVVLEYEHQKAIEDSEIEKDKNETLEANRGNIDPEIFNTFKSQWENANRSHGALQDFSPGPDSFGHATSKPFELRRRPVDMLYCQGAV